jgi:CDP-6-deoxy-D-xylo-4-hexulose-3-dehydrase
MKSESTIPINIIRNQIIEKIKEYHIALELSKEPFIAGQTQVNYAGRVYDQDELINLVNASLDFWLTSGKYTDQFEKEFSQYINIKYSLFVNSGSSANLLAFSTLTSPDLGNRQIKRGNQVITIACCFPTTVAPIIQYGAIPLFLDVDLKTLNIDVSLLEEAYNPNVKAVMIAHTLGNPFNIKAVQEFCNKYNLWLISDCCDALGSKYDDRYVGEFGDISTFSFYPAHHITTGEGGMMSTNNPILHRIAVAMRDWGRDCQCQSGQDNRCQRRFDGFYDHKYIYSQWGYNLKATDLQASIGCAQLKKIDTFIEQRKANFNYLLNKLSPLNEYFDFIIPTENSDPSWFGFPLLIKNSLIDRNLLVSYLENNNIQTRLLFAGNLIRQPCMKQFKIEGKLINTDKVMNDLFWIGVAPTMTKEKLDYMCDIIFKFITTNKYEPCSKNNINK